MADKKEKPQKQNVKQKQKQTTVKAPSKAKETIAELKKVSWPGFGKVWKGTLVVLSVVATFLVVLFGIDWVLSLLHKLLVS